MENLAEFYRAVRSDGEAHGKQQPLAITDPVFAADPVNYHYLLNGQHERIPKPRVWRSYRADTLDSLCQMLRDFSLHSTVAWNGEGLTAYLEYQPDDPKPVDTVYMLCESTDVFSELEDGGPVKREPKAFVDYCEHNLYAVDGLAELIAAAKDVRFDVTTSSDIKTDHGASKVGKRFEERATGTAEMPRHVTVSFPPYPQFADELKADAPEDAACCVVHVECSVGIYPGSGELALRPRPGQIEQAKRQAKASFALVLSQLLPDHATVYCGEIR